MVDPVLLWCGGLLRTILIRLYFVGLDYISKVDPDYISSVIFCWV